MKYSIKAFVVYVFAMVVILGLHEFTSIEFKILHVVLLGLFMFGTSTLVHYLTLNASKENPKRFPAYFMAITGLKMMTYIVAVGIYAFLYKEDAIPMIVVFLILYVIYTILEVISALAELKKQG